MPVVSFTPLPEVTAAFFKSLKSLRGSAVRLTGSAARADDLLQTVAERAWAALERFEPGTNMSAWLFTIMRNEHLSAYRRTRREVEDPDGVFASQVSVAPNQETRLYSGEVRRALTKLNPEHLEAISLVCVNGLSYLDAAARCGVSDGTMKSRVSRARAVLAQLLGFDSPGEALA